MRNFSRSQQVTLIAIALTILVFGLLRSPQGRYLASSQSSEPRRQWAVEVTGEVNSPGIYIFPDRPTTSQVLAKTGGLQARSRLAFPDGHESLCSGTRLEMRVRPPTGAVTHRSHMCARTRLVLGIPVELNQVQAGDLALVPGISRGLARRIVENRESHGPFTTWCDLRRVKGVGPGKTRVLQNYLTVVPP